MKTIDLIMGFVLLVGGIIIRYSNEYLVRKQKELEHREIREVNPFSPLFGPDWSIGPAFIITGSGFPLLCFFKEF
jgi:hypothetical protein